MGKVKATAATGVVAKRKVTLQIRIELVDAATGAVSLWRDFTEADPVTVTAGNGAKQPKGSLWHALREFIDVQLIGRDVGYAFEHTYTLPFGERDPAQVKTFTGKKMQDVLGLWELASWQEAKARMAAGLAVHNAWAKGRVVEVDETKIVLDGNGHAGNHLRVAGKILAIAAK